MATECPIPNREPISKRVECTDRNALECMCPNCPTYLSSQCPAGKEEKIFCSIGMTECNLEQKGCICGDCPVFVDKDLSVGYFCVKGEADEDGKPITAQ